MSIFDKVIEKATTPGGSVAKTALGPAEVAPKGRFEAAVEAATVRGTAFAAPTDDPSKYLSLGTLIKLKTADTPSAKKRIVANDLFETSPDKYKRVRITGDGQVAYKDVDGEWYLAGSDAMSTAGAIGAKSAPPAVGAMIGGALGGFPGGILGAVAGSLVGEKGEEMLLGDRPNYMRTGANELMWSGLGEGALMGGKALGNVVRKSTGMGLDPSFNADEILRLQQSGRNMGVDMSLAEAYGKGNPAMLQWLMSKHPLTSTRTAERLEAREGGIDDAIQGYLSMFSRQEAPAIAERKGLRAAGEYRERLVNRRREGAAPLYRQAESDSVDVTGFIDELESLVDVHGGTPLGNRLKSWRKRLMELDGEDMVPKERLDKLQSVAISMADDIKTLDKAGNTRQAGILRPLERDLRQTLHSQSASYQAADEQFKNLSRGINRFDDETIIGPIARKAELDKAKAGLSDTLFSPKASSPQQVRRAKRMISAVDPQAWDDLVRSQMQRAINTQREILKSGERANIPGNLIYALEKSRATRDLWEAAIGRQRVADMRSLLGVMERVAMASKDQSWTAPAGEMLNRMKGEKASIFNIPGRLSDALQEDRFSRNFNELFDVIWSQPETAREVRSAMIKINRMSPDFIRSNPKVTEAAVRSLFASVPSTKEAMD